MKRENKWLIMVCTDRWKLTMALPPYELVWRRIEWWTYNVYAAYEIAYKWLNFKGSQEIARQITGLNEGLSIVMDRLLSLKCAGGTNSIISLLINRARHGNRFVLATFLRMDLCSKMEESIPFSRNWTNYQIKFSNYYC